MAEQTVTLKLTKPEALRYNGAGGQGRQTVDSGSTSIFAIVSVILALTAAPTQAGTLTSDKVWHWYAHCAQPRRVEIDVILDRRRVYSSVSVACLLASDAIDDGHEQRILKFNLVSSRRSLFGERQGEVLEGNIWEAGRDPIGLVLGVSFSGRRQVWCNRLRPLDLGKISELRLARGLSVRTIPDG